MDKDNELEDSEQNDYQEYLRDMEQLKDDFSDLEDLDLDEIEAMREAISQVKSLDEEDIEPTEVLEEKKLNDEAELPQQEDMSPPVEQIEEPPIKIKEELMTDFSDLGKMDLEELIEMKKAVQEVQSEEIELDRNESSESSEASSTDELEKRLREELDIRREERKEDLMTEKKFLDYLKEKRDKIWYHALYYLAFEPEDHTASKEFLYEILKEETSKSAIDPIPEHQFYFGLGYILRLNIENSQVVRYKTGGKFKIEYNISVIRSLLKEAGEPISTKPTIEIKKQKKMFKDFLEDDFSDI
ncbi:MAG: hypothetical protein GF317_05355 [Candidatus Lokiarchaeota archaeon]|nr:hypothetical protein [Candidatus Lokiarchaeota archaeon]MBD3199234.1 hypothetical protein [Candidatus Lokiarchaeota archaeon]